MKNEKKRIVYICSRIPDPEFSGFNLRVRNTLRILSQQYEVDLVCLSSSDTADFDLSGLKSEVNSLVVFRVSPFSMSVGLTKALVTGRPLQTGLYASPQLTSWLKENGHEYDAMYCHLMRTAEYANLFDGPKVIDLNDLISRHYQTGTSVGSMRWRLARKFEAGRALRYEGDLLNRFDLAYIHTESDKQFALSAHPGSADVLKISAMGIPEEFESDPGFNRRGPVESSFVIQFVGKMNYEPNVDAALYFSSEIFPLVREVIPNAEFHIVGDQPADSVAGLSSQPKVIVTGRVHDLAERVRSADVSVAPMRTGGGIQNKVIQAMAQRVPVVLSSVAARGVHGTNGVDYLIADSPTETVNAIKEIYDDRVRAEELATSARSLVVDKYLWSGIGASMLADIAELVVPVG